MFQAGPGDAGLRLPLRKNPPPSGARPDGVTGASRRIQAAEMVRSHKRHVLPAAPLPVRPAFRREFLDFDRGIRMGNLEPHERITQILKYRLVARHGQEFIVDKWGRGTYWQWICWLPRANRQAKPVSSGYNFSCAKFFIDLDRQARELHAGLQVERARVRRGRAVGGDVCLADDWDYHRLVGGLKNGRPLAAELERLLSREGFTAMVGSPDGSCEFRGRRWGGPSAIRRAMLTVPADSWAWFQLYYPIAEKELDQMSGEEIVDAVAAIFDEVTPAMNLIMQAPYLAEAGGRARPGRVEAKQGARHGGTQAAPQALESAESSQERPFSH